ncbi:CRP/FNR family transcriptional regulator [Alkalibacillus filiformis]|uniref:CRP/FNR family transcriptional regulator n=1 Tax=Alkalibacillus filiformis TaxID=200990 RepID=A0ABU0DV08_9BACI|nr:Crp/Fnr family transcriptional regulator [Alkalibacillus filiformis]MDQ0352121.1 CRP/FNR family transcriptional regulator [Alkalibacillus filiformis]
MACSVNFFKQFPIFQDLSPEELEEVGKIAHHRKFKKGDIIFREGARRESVYFVIHGLIKVYKVSVDGKEQVINLIHSDEMFPHVGFFDQTPYPATAITLTDVNVIAVPIEAFENLLLQKPQISIKVMRVMGKKILELQDRIQQMSTQTVFERTVTTLIRITEEMGKHRQDDSIYVHIPITNSDLANMIGVTRESVNRTFNKLRKEELISYNRNEIIVYNMDDLKSYQTT